MGLHEDIAKKHENREKEGKGARKEVGHKEVGHIPSGSVNVGAPDLDASSRPELHLYSFKVGNQEKHRFVARLHAADKPALVIRVDPEGPRSGEQVVEKDTTKTLFILDTGEIVIKSLPDNVQRFEFSVENPGAGVGDYNC